MQKQRSPQRSSDSPTKIPKEEISHEVVEFHSLDESIFNTKQDKSGLNFFYMFKYIWFDISSPSYSNFVFELSLISSTIFSWIYI